MPTAALDPTGGVPQPAPFPIAKTAPPNPIAYPGPGRRSSGASGQCPPGQTLAPGYGRPEKLQPRITLPRSGFKERILSLAGVQNAFKSWVMAALTNEGINVARAHGFALRQTVPMADLKRSSHSELHSFVARRLPAWQQSLESRGIS